MEIQEEISTLNCPLCCNETFNTLEELKNHIEELGDKLNCPFCSKNFTDLKLFNLHFNECENVKTIQNDDLLILKEENNYLNDIPAEEENKFYCEICGINFNEMKEHLNDYHMGQEVIVESHEIDNSVLDTNEYNENFEQIFLKKEQTTDQITKLNMIQTTTSKLPPNIEYISYVNGTTTVTEDNINKTNSIKIYRCPNCNIRFTQFKNFKKHECNSGIGEICEICSIHFASKGALTFHKRKLHTELSNIEQPVKDKSTDCPICHIKFPSIKSMNLHKRIHTNNTQKQKIDPPVTYSVNGNEIIDGNDEIFTCNVCHKDYNKKYEKVHLKSHVEEIFICTICNRKFLNENDLKLHSQAHGNDTNKKLSCNLCKKMFTNENLLKNHVEVECHGKKYVCDYCGRKFTRPHEKVKHERIHTGQKPHKCEVCGKCFRVSYCLSLHLRTHTGLRPYKCKICEKRFKSHSVYTHHIQIHSDERPYKCTICPKTFKTSVQLAGHKNTHTKPFNCNLCNRPFATLYAVRLHVQSHNDKLSKLNHQCHICGAVYARHFALRDHFLTHKNEDTKENSVEIDINPVTTNC